MPKFVTIGYGDRAGYDRTPPAVRDAAHAHDAELQRQGVLMGIAGAPVRVRNPEAVGVETTPGAFMISALPVAGFAVVEAADLAEAIAMVSRTPAPWPMAWSRSGRWRRRPARRADCSGISKGAFDSNCPPASLSSHKYPRGVRGADSPPALSAGRDGPLPFPMSIA